ncbi:hypothetical protein C489_09050 [Natrinema versiforme JCM 10478]|uniref:Uncharacterized protein n=2 Tax=Natrinema versiforme TaxID=88724 RepID=L9Y5I0_9EURY|nr:hypothetical protein C489_09050 [Natrinema versiforme JCM 10478]
MGFDIPVGLLAAIVVAFLAGACCPTYYATERLRGFGRATFARIPYQPPPGMDRDEAMQAALENAEEHDAEKPTES